MLDFDLERMLVEQVIRRSNRKIELMFEYASTKTLRNMVTLGHRALHFSGHGFKDSLAFEDEHGGLHMVVVNQLRHLCAAGGKKSSKTSRKTSNTEKGVQFVFVSACYSQSAGEAFVQAGIPHVVCVSVNSNLLDKAAQEFAHTFYLSLAVGGTVADSFEIGVEAVKKCSTHGKSNQRRRKILTFTTRWRPQCCNFCQRPNSKYISPWFKQNKVWP